MAVYANINGVIHELAGVVSATPVSSDVPARDDAEVTSLMTSQNSAGFVASASSEYAEGGVSAKAWKAFSGVGGSGWANGWSSTAKPTPAAPQFLQLDLPSAKPVYSYRLTIRTDANSLAPSAWIFQGWDGSVWHDLHSVTGQTWTNGETKEFQTQSQGNYSRYRWLVSDGGALVQLAKARLFS